MNTHLTSTVRTALATVVLALTAVLPTAYAQVGSTGTVANVPFAFAYNSHQLPAGHYTLTRADDGVLQVRGGSATIECITVPGTYPDRNVHSRLVFHHYGTHYFLANVIDRNGNNISILTSKGEKAARHSEKMLVARAKRPAQQVNVEVAAVAAQR